MQSVSARWCLGKVLDYGARGREIESSAGLENFPGMCKQCNIILVNNLVVHKIQSKLSMNICICDNNVICIQNNGSITIKSKV